MIKPVGNRVLVKVIEEEDETTPGGFVKAQGARKDKPLRGKVYQVGEVKSEVGIGDTIYFASYGYDEVEEYVVVPGDLILGVEM